MQFLFFNSTIQSGIKLGIVQNQFSIHYCLAFLRIDSINSFATLSFSVAYTFLS
jgi:hypothetical protein